MGDALSNQQRHFVVERLAAFDAVTEVVKALLEQFVITVAPHVVAAYNPTQCAGQHCPAHWKSKFFDARRALSKRSSH